MAAPETASDPAEPIAVTPPSDRAPLALIVLRDVAIVAAALSLFAAADSWRMLTGSGLAALLSVVDGLLVGAGVSALLHEWGHWIGARLGGAVAPLKPMKGFLPLFDFDYARSSDEAFRAMSIGGNLGHAFVLAVFVLALPLGSPGQVALVAGSLGFAVFASSIEIPVILRSRQGASSLEALGTIPRDFVKRHGRYGLGAALVTLLVL